jgi:hypothetical protein
MDEEFSLPGSDGELDPSSNMWRKRIVFTNRVGSQDQGPTVVKQGYRVSVAFKRGISENIALRASTTCTKAFRWWPTCESPRWRCLMATSNQSD